MQARPAPAFLHAPLQQSESEPHGVPVARQHVPFDPHAPQHGELRVHRVPGDRQHTPAPADTDTPATMAAGIRH